MTPSNPTNSQPLIYRIADALGITHLVVAVQHSHLMSEITGLAAALAGKANAIPAGSPSGAIVIVDTSGNIGRSSTNLTQLLGSISEKANTAFVITELEKKQDTLTFDSTPTTGSNNPVTSGGVKTALENVTPYRMIDPEGGLYCEIYLYGNDGALIKAPLIDLRIGNEQADVTADSLANLKRAMVAPDSTPIANSDNLVTSGGVKQALDGKANINHTHTSISNETANESASVGVSEGTVNIEVRDEGGGGECEITPSNIGNLFRALSDPDTTPTLNSTNLVTSGGVKAALDGKAPAGDTEVVFVEGENILLYLPNYFANGERQRSFLLDYQGDVEELISLFMGDTYDTIHILSHDSSTIMVGGCYIAVRVIKQPGGATQGDTYYIIFDGKADY